MRAAFLALSVAWGTAQACGYCVEDKIAATYDHAVITTALAKKHHVVFLHVEGAAQRRTTLEEAVYAAPGVDRGTARISSDLLTVSFAFDPARASLGAIHTRIEKKLRPARVSLLPFQVLERPEDLKLVRSAR